MLFLSKNGGVVMKKILLLLLALALSVSAFAGCDREEPSDSSSAPPSESSFAPDESSSSSNDPSLPEPSVQAPNETKVEVKQTKKYYRQISSGYSRTTATSTGIHHDGKVFLDGVFEMNQASQYKVLSSHSELQAFSLLNYDEAEANLFEENRVVAILRYHKGPSGDAKRESGLYNARFDANDGVKIELDLYYSGLDSTEDEIDVYELYFIVVPKAEVEQAEPTGGLTVNAKLLAQYNADTYKIENAVEKTEAYYIPSAEAKDRIELFDTVSIRTHSYPFLAIHLEEAIETDFIVNGFKYENGEIYITIQIFEKTEMSNSHELPANLLIVSLQPHRWDLEIAVPNNMPADSPINITLEYVS